jgi:hypothetical protein
MERAKRRKSKFDISDDPLDRAAHSSYIPIAAEFDEFDRVRLGGRANPCWSRPVQNPAYIVRVGDMM